VLRGKEEIRTPGPSRCERGARSHGYLALRLGSSQFNPGPLGLPYQRPLTYSRPVSVRGPPDTPSGVKAY